MVADTITSAMVLGAYFAFALGLGWVFYRLWW